MPGGRPSKRNSKKSAPTLRIDLIHWNTDEARVRAGELRNLGHIVDVIAFGPGQLKTMRQHPPDAVVIDLTRLPSHGRDAAFAIREQKSTRMIPIVFVEGEREKVEAIRNALPDAGFATWKGIDTAVRKAIFNRPREPVVPKSRLDGYSGTPLPKKLGIKADFRVELVDAPPGFEEELGTFEASATLKRKKIRILTDSPSKGCDLALWFVQSRPELAMGAGYFAQNCPTGGVWFIWRKKAAAGAKPKISDNDVPAVGERDVREAGLAAGLVDFKICAVNAVWSGLKFTLRKEDRAKRLAAGRKK